MTAFVRLLAWLLALALVTLPVVAVLNGWIAADRWPLQRLQLTGEFQRVDETQVRAAVLPHVDAGFFALELERVRAALLALPWVEKAEVRKRWPDTLEVALVEHRAWARWGERQLLSDRGRLFTVPDVDGLHGLPHLDGPETRLDEVVRFYNRAREQFAGTGFRVTEVALDARGGWSVALDDGTEVIIGRTDAQARLARFTRLLPQLLAAEGRPLARADLRYTNGFALVWANPGLGIRDSGLEPPARALAMRMCAADIPTPHGCPTPAPTNLQSRIPNPGSET